MGKDALQLRTKKYFALLQAVIEGFDSHAVASQYEATLRLDPDRDCEHSPEARKARVTPVQVRMQRDFSITMRLEAEAGLLQL